MQGREGKQRSRSVPDLCARGGGEPTLMGR